MKTFATVLSSSIECKVLRTADGEVLQIGGLISGQDCTRIVESCAVLQKLGRSQRNCLFSTMLVLGFWRYFLFKSCLLCVERMLNEEISCIPLDEALYV